jgi:hypothetical protein
MSRIVARTSSIASTYKTTDADDKKNMSTLKVETLHREFFYNGTRIPDPAPGMSVEQVREMLTPSFPGSPPLPSKAPKIPAQPCAIPSVAPSVPRASDDGPANDHC